MIRVLSFIGIVMVWVGVFNLLDYYLFTPTLWMEFVQLAFAILLLSLVYIFKNRMSIWISSCVTLFAWITSWKCTWNICEDHIAKPSLGRELIYMSIGITLLLLTRTFHEKANG
jgi:hypothetical protein